MISAALVMLQAAAGTPVDWRARDLTPGAWNWQSTPTSSEALFVDGAGVQLSIRCDYATRTVIISRPGSPATAGIRIATTSLDRSLGPGGAVAAGDPFLDGIAFSRGRFFVGVAGRLPLILRSAAEPARAIEDCRSRV